MNYLITEIMEDESVNEEDTIEFHDYYKYRVSYITQKNLNLVFLFVTGLTDKFDNIKKELIKCRKEFINLFEEILQHRVDAKTFEVFDPIVDVIHKNLRPKISLVGFSGVGKTTLINKLIGANMFATDAIREKDGKGRHVTARRQMVILEQGGLIIDTPGMRELGNIGVDTGLGKTFMDIVNLAQDCRFKNCTHVNEPDCAVTKAIKNGELSAKRYQNYLKIRKESEFHEMSYLEKRNKDKKFGKMVKSVMKDKKKAMSI